MGEPLHVEVTGEGRPIVLLHGWGMHAGVFQDLSEQLAPRHRMLAVDLPGHGESEVFDQFNDLAKLTAHIIEQLLPLVQTGFTLLGWSLGGLLAQAMAIRYPQYINKLVLLCSSPLFQRRDDWPHAVEADVLRSFAAELQRDYRGTLARFLALQFLGSENQKETLRRARTLLFARPQPDPATLEQGLQLLNHTDLRQQLSQIQCPVLVLNAEHDTLVPPGAGRYLAEHVANGRAVIIKGAGHAPFLSHRQILTNFLERFLDEY
ncbi:MAG: pimeloyl-ACP methyl ester esterase BioH [Gammaproteobacteria bacterium]